MRPRPALPAKAASKAWLRALELTAPIANSPLRNFPAVIAELAERFGDAPALVSDAETFGFSALNARANRYARWALAQNLGHGDNVALLMPNRPEYMAIWLGITRAGGAVALINTNLAGPALAHCLDIVAPKYIIVADELIDALETAQPHRRTAAKNLVARRRHPLSRYIRRGRPTFADHACGR